MNYQNHSYPVDPRRDERQLFVYSDGRAIGMARETQKRFKVRAHIWIRIRDGKWNS